jgi:hypothetical protein
MGFFHERILGSWPIRDALAWGVRHQLNQFEKLTRQPRAAQDALLRRILAQQAQTDFGRDHGFGSVSNRDEFRRQVPILRYEYLEPYIARCRRGDFGALLSEPCVHMFALTSGSTAARKYIPVTPQYLRDYRRAWNLWGYRAWQDHPEVRLKPVVQCVGDWDEFRTEANIPCGALTGLTAHIQKRFIRWLYCVPAATSRVKDAHAKYYLALRFSLQHNIGMLIAANPSSLVALGRTGDQEKETLIRDIYQGTLSSNVGIPDDLRLALSRRLQPVPQRARELEAVANRAGRLYPRHYWDPSSFLISTWTGGSAGAYLRQFSRYFGNAPVRDIGLLASEGRMTIPFADDTPSGVLDIQSHYFEFLPEEEVDSTRPNVLSADEVREGKRYFILLTTAYGLYRYNIGDLVQVTGFHNRTPLVEFLSKGANFSSVTGEKLSEYQVTKVMAELCRSLDLSLTSYSMAPCWNDTQPYYGLFVEKSDLQDEAQGGRLVHMLDRRLSELNCEYAGKRNSRRLGGIRLQLLPSGAWQAWDRHRLKQTGGTLEQYKHPCLINDLKFRDAMTVLEEVSPRLNTSLVA